MFEKKERVSKGKVLFFLCLVGVTMLFVVKGRSSDEIKNNKSSIHGFQDDTNSSNVKVVQQDNTVKEIEPVTSSDNLNKAIVGLDEQTTKNTDNKKTIGVQENEVNKNESESKDDKKNATNDVVKEKSNSAVKLGSSDNSEKKDSENNMVKKQDIKINNNNSTVDKKNTESVVDNKLSQKKDAGLNKKGDKKSEIVKKSANTTLKLNEKKTKSDKIATKATTSTYNKFVIQIGAYKDAKVAKQHCDKIAGKLSGGKKCVVSTGKDIFRAVVLPFSDQARANKYAKDLSSRADIDCFVKRSN